MTRTINRNIRLMSAKAVITTTTRRRKSLSGASGSGIPAMKDPITSRNIPASTALIVPEILNPAINSNLVMGVTRYPS